MRLLVNEGETPRPFTDLHKIMQIEWKFSSQREEMFIKEVIKVNEYLCH